MTKHHILQSDLWKFTKENLGTKIVRSDNTLLYVLETPLGKKVGYVPRPNQDEVDWDNLVETAKIENCIYVTVDPNNLKSESSSPLKVGQNIKSGLPVHLQNNVIISLKESEDEILARMDRKYRYNVRYGIKNGIEVKFDNSEDSFETFLKNYLDTKERQNYFGRGEKYIRSVWESFKQKEKEDGKQYIQIAHAYFEGEALVSWFMFLYEDTVYYPYGGSSIKHRNLKATYSIVYEVLKWAKSQGFAYFDFWGIEEEIGSNDGFSSFKLGFGGEQVEYQDTFDIIINPFWYRILKFGLFLRNKFKVIKKLT